MAQYELIITAAGWLDQTKALQLALALTEDSSACLLLLRTEERHDYTFLVGTLQGHFGEFNIKDSLHSEFKRQDTQLAYDIERLSTCAYAAMAPMIQCELAREQFVQD